MLWGLNFQQKISKSTKHHLMYGLSSIQTGATADFPCSKLLTIKAIDPANRAHFSGTKSLILRNIYNGTDTPRQPSYNYLENSGPITLVYRGCHQSVMLQGLETDKATSDHLRKSQVHFQRTPPHWPQWNKKPCSSLENNVVVSEVRNMSRQAQACSQTLMRQSDRLSSIRVVVTMVTTRQLKTKSGQTMHFR